MCSLKVCPVDGCTSIPLKYLKQHIASVHPFIPSETAAQLLRSAAVFHVPSGKKRKDVVVRKGRKLQLAKKSTTGRRQFETYYNIEDGTAASNGVELTSCEEEQSKELVVEVVDKGTQCNLLPEGYLESWNTSRTRKGQYAKKSTSSIAQNIRRHSISTTHLMTQTTTSYHRSPAIEYYSSTITPAPITAPISAPTSLPIAGEPCEFICKLGDWDVIFYELPNFLYPTHSNT